VVGWRGPARGYRLSYLNLFDADAAWRLVHELRLDAPEKKAVAIIKHANARAPRSDLTRGRVRQGVARRPPERLRGIIAIDGVLDAALASMIAAGPQADVIIASSIDDEAIAILVKRRKATRLLSAPSPEPLGLSCAPRGQPPSSRTPTSFSCR